jgi:uncharacterized protein with beta-barrel porin domain
MVSKNTSLRTSAKQSIAEKLNQNAYSYYGAATIARTDNGASSSKLKQLAAAALLTSSSMLVLSSNAQATVSVCTPAMPSVGGTVNCTGTTTVRQFFGVNDLTIIADQNFNSDTSGTVATGQRVNSGIMIQGSGGTIRNSGTIITGQQPDEGSTHGQHNGLFILGGAGDVYAENTATGSITTTDYESNGIQISATTGRSIAVNRGTILTTGDSSYGVAAANTYIAISRNFGTVTTQSDNGQGVYSYSYSSTATSTNDGTISVSGDLSAGIVSVGSTSATSANNASGTINASGSGAAGGVFAVAISSSGTASATNSGAINLSGVKGPTYGGFSNFGVISSGRRATATNAAGATITDTGTQYATAGIFATTDVNSPFSRISPPAAMGATTADAVNQGTITLNGNYSTGVQARASDGTATAINGGTISVTGSGTAGIRVTGKTVVATNTGAITVNAGAVMAKFRFGDAVGIFAYSDSPNTTTVTNSGTITATGLNPIGVFASGPTTNVTNSAGGTITATNAIAIGTTSMATIDNAGTVNGNVILGFGKFRETKTDQALVTNTGTINGQITSHSFYNTTVVNNGGTVGDGTYAIFTGLGNNSVTISGSGNVIKGGISDRAANAMYTAVLNFNQTDTLTLDDGGYNDVAVQNFTSINFNNGTTSFDGTSINSPAATISVNAGATLTTASTAFGITAPQVNVGGTGTRRGTVAVPAGSTITVSGDVTFNEKGRFQPGVASDTSAGVIEATHVTFNAGSEVYADVTRGVDLTPGNAIKVAGGSMAVVDNGLTVFDNSTLFDFNHEVRTGNELYLVVERVLTAAQATTNAGGRASAEDIAGALDTFISNAPTDNPIVAYLAQFPVAEQEAKLFQLVKDSLPSESGATGAGTVVSTDMVLDLIMDRLSGGGFVVVDSGERQTGVAAGEQLLGGDGNWALWGRAGASFADYNPATVNGFESDTYAVSLGLDGDITENLRMGVAVFYSDTSVDETGAGANSGQEIEGLGALIYGTYRPEDFYVNGTVGLGLNEYDSSRNALGGVNRANYDGVQFMSRVEVGKVFTEGAWDLSPHVGLRFNYVAIEGYTETGPLPTSVASQNITSLRGVLGLSGRYTEVMDDGSKIIPEAYVRVLQELADPNSPITGTVVGGGTFVSQSTARDNLSYAIGTGFTYEMDESTSVRFLYDGEFQEDYQEHSLTAAVRFQF